jgi:hypothetical protein
VNARIPKAGPDNDACSVNYFLFHPLPLHENEFTPAFHERNDQGNQSFERAHSPCRQLINQDLTNHILGALIDHGHIAQSKARRLIYQPRCAAAEGLDKNALNIGPHHGDN